MVLICGYGGLGVFGVFMGVLVWVVLLLLVVWMVLVVIGMVLVVLVVVLIFLCGFGVFLYCFGLFDIFEENILLLVLVCVV